MHIFVYLARLFIQVRNTVVMGKGMTSRRAIALLKSKGWVIVRTRGSHTVWRSPQGAQFTLPDGHREISPGVTRNLLKAMEASHD